MKPVVRAFFAMLALLLSGCNGMFDEVYDEAMDIVPAEGQIVVDATDWGAWYYIDLEKLRQLSLEDDADALIKAQTEHTPYPIPTVLTGDGDGKSGQYLYWFDVWGEGIRNNEFREFTPCDARSDSESNAV